MDKLEEKKRIKIYIKKNIKYCDIDRDMDIDEKNYPIYKRYNVETNLVNQYWFDKNNSKLQFEFWDNVIEYVKKQIIKM